MPIYEYKCQKCASHLEFQQSMTAKPKTRCPKCKGKLTKLISQTAFQLKGTGWYVTDFAGRKKPEEKEDKKPAAIPVEKPTEKTPQVEKVEKKEKKTK